MMGMSGGGGGSIINPTMRQLHMPGNAKSELLSATSSGLSEDVMHPGDVISDMGAVIGCNNNQKTSVQCGSGVGVVTGTTAAGVNVNMHCSSSGAPNGNMMGSSTDMLASFGNTSCNVIGTAPDMSKEVLNQDSRTHSHQGGVAQMEWSKIQHQFFEERLKGQAQTSHWNCSTTTANPFWIWWKLVKQPGATPARSTSSLPLHPEICVSTNSHSIAQSLESKQSISPVTADNRSSHGIADQLS